MSVLGFTPNELKEPGAIGTTPAWPNVLVGENRPWLRAPKPYPVPNEASVFTFWRDNTFCLAINSKPFGDLVSNNILDNLLTSVPAASADSNPPLNKKSTPLLGKGCPSSCCKKVSSAPGIDLIIYGWPLLPWSHLSPPLEVNFNLFKSVVEFINI